MKKRFSIIIPTYNCEHLIEKTLCSIMKQKRELYECLVIDGKSNDKTIEIVSKYNAKNKNIKYITEKDNGIYDAMNKGIDVSSGEYLYFIGAGDILCDDVLERLNKDIDGEDLIYGNVYIMNTNKKIVGEKRKEDLIYFFLNHQSIFYKRNIFDVIGKYDLKYSIYADNILNKKIFGDDNLIKKYIEIDIAHYLGGGISDTFIDKEYEKNYKKIIIDCFGEKYLRKLYYNILNAKKDNITNFIAWGNGGEYENAKKDLTLNIKYFIKSRINYEGEFEGKKVISPEKFLSYRNEKNMILVFTACYYEEIRQWLVKEGFHEFEDFMLITDKVINILKEIDN